MNNITITTYSVIEVLFDMHKLEEYVGTFTCLESAKEAARNHNLVTYLGNRTLPEMVISTKLETKKPHYWIVPKVHELTFD